MYVDTCYVAKYYLMEPDSAEVRRCLQEGGSRTTSEWAWIETHSLLHRH